MKNETTNPAGSPRIEGASGERQSTPLGFKLPVPSKSQVMRDFEKIALARGSVEDDADEDDTPAQ